MRKLTTIELPHGSLRVVGPLLQQAGFTLGTVGGGHGQMEREGTLTDDEQRELKTKMGELLFLFEIQEID